MMKRQDNVHLNLANKLYKNRKVEQALSECLHIIETYPNEIPAYTLMALILAEQGKIEPAKDVLQKAVSLDSASVEVYTTLGVINLIAHDLDESEKALQKASELNPNFWKAHFNMAILYSERGNFSQALRSSLLAFTNHFSIQTLHGFIRSFINKSPRLTYILVILFILIPFVIRKPASLIFTFLLTSMFALETYFNIRTKKVKRSIIGIILGILFLYWHLTIILK